MNRPYFGKLLRHCGCAFCDESSVFDAHHQHVAGLLPTDHNEIPWFFQVFQSKKHNFPDTTLFF